jgi:hypothetical protein
MRLLWTRFLVVSLAALFAALPAQAQIGASYLCHMTGRVSDTHCCTGTHAEVCHPQVEQPDCCELLQAQGHAITPATRSSGTQDAPVYALIPAPVFSRIAHSVAQPMRGPWQAAARPPGRPRFLVNCSLLI